MRKPRKSIVYEASNPAIGGGFGHSHRRPRVATLHRVSSMLDRQDPTLARTQLRAHASAIGDLVPDLEIEERGSGAKRDREGLNKIMEAARRGRFDVLVFWKLDRLSRNVRDLHNIAATLAAYGVELSCCTQPIDTRTPSGKLLFGVLALLAEHERDTIRERVLLGLERARAKGKRLGRPKEERPTAAEVIELRKEGLSWRAVARRLGVGVHRCRLRVEEVKSSGARP